MITALVIRGRQTWRNPCSAVYDSQTSDNSLMAQYLQNMESKSALFSGILGRLMRREREHWQCRVPKQLSWWQTSLLLTVNLGDDKGRWAHPNFYVLASINLFFMLPLKSGKKLLNLTTCYREQLSPSVAKTTSCPLYLFSTCFKGTELQILGYI